MKIYDLKVLCTYSSFNETDLLYMYSIGLKIAVENADVYIRVPEGNVKKFPLPMKHLSFRRN